MDFESFSGSPRPLGEGLGVRAETTVLNVDLVYILKPDSDSDPDLRCIQLPQTQSA